MREHFNDRIARLDLSLFDQIESQTSTLDRRSLLACQLAIRTLKSSYVYLEIGSHLGGSLVPHLLDERCEHIFSIDKRPRRPPDARGRPYEYADNSTSRMLENLKRVSPSALHKVTCLDDDAANIDPATITPKPQICFIDGEHTDSACVSDSRFCSMVMDHNGLLVFHDACVVYNGLATIVESLNARRMSFHAYNLPDVLFVIESGDCAIHKLRCVEELLIANHLGYLSSLQRNDGYRRFANRTPFRQFRSLKAGLTRATSFR
jgi:hypothetical protein